MLKKKTCVIPLIPAKAHPASLHPLVIPDITSVAMETLNLPVEK